MCKTNSETRKTSVKCSCIFDGVWLHAPACSKCRDVGGLFARVSISLAVKLICWIFRDTSTVFVESHGRRRKAVLLSDNNNAHTVYTSSQVVCQWNNTRFFHMPHSLTHIDPICSLSARVWMLKRFNTVLTPTSSLSAISHSIFFVSLRFYLCCVRRITNTVKVVNI